MTSPSVGSIRRRIKRPVVDLPQPDSPTIPKVSPSRTKRSSPSTALTAPTCLEKRMPRLIGKCFLRPLTSNSTGFLDLSVLLLIVRPLPSIHHASDSVQIDSHPRESVQVLFVCKYIWPRRSGAQSYSL